MGEAIEVNMEIDLQDTLIHLMANEVEPPTIEQAMACQNPEEVLAFAQAAFDVAFEAGYLMRAALEQTNG
jgi:hypothetical protein